MQPIVAFRLVSQPNRLIFATASQCFHTLFLKHVLFFWSISCCYMLQTNTNSINLLLLCTNCFEQHGNSTAVSGFLFALLMEETACKRT